MALFLQYLNVKLKTGLPVFLTLCLLSLCLLLETSQGNRIELVQRLENTLLDMRLRVRAERFAPSPEVIVVAFDQGSKAYFEKHPEAGVNGSTLPRDKLARVINELSRRGAASILLDVELKSVSANPEDDQLLAKAIRQAGNVSVASYTDNTLHDFLIEDRDARAETLYRSATFISAYIQPFLIRSVSKCRYLPLACAADFWSLNAQRTYDLKTMSLVLPTDWETHWQALGDAAFLASNGYGHGLRQPQKLLDSAASPLQEAYARVCLRDAYRQLYSNRPQFLARLARQPREQLVFEDKPDIEAEQNFSYCRMSPVIEPVAAAVKDIGISTVNYEEKAFLRQVPVFYKGYEGRYFYYLPMLPAFQKWQVQFNQSQHGAKAALLEISQKGLKISGQKTIDFFRHGQVLINWRNPRLLAAKIYTDMLGQVPKEADSVSTTRANRVLGYGHLYRVISVADLIKRQADASASVKNLTPSLYEFYGEPASGEFDFKNKVVIYGDAVKDIHITPVGDIIYGPEILANVADMVLNDQNFVHPAPSWQAWLITLVLFGLIVYPIMVWPSFLAGVLIALGGLGMFWAHNFLMFTQEGLYFPVVWPTVLAFCCILGSMFYHYNVQDREKRQLTNVFSKYVSPQVMAEILSDTNAALENLKGKKKELTVLFTDIHNFTEQFENAEPEKMVLQLNDYFNAMIAVVLAHGGTYDKYMGDALMAFFGAPADNPAHAENACRAALDMASALADLNARWQQSGLPVLRHGIGLASGPMFVGNLGSDEIKNFTVMGSVVNLGARLEALTRQLDAEILVNTRTKALAENLPGLSFPNMGEVLIKGFSQPVQVYALSPSKLNEAQEGKV